jgi:hypothetical protein
MIERSDLADISPADKGAIPRHGQDREPQLRIGGQPACSFEELGHQRAIEAIQLLGVVDRHPRNGTTFGALLAPNDNTHRPPASSHDP